MKFKFVLPAAIVTVLGVSLAFGSVTTKKTVRSAEQTVAAAAKAEKLKQMKDILFKLVRQDEYLDEVIETLDTANARLTAQDISALSLRLKIIQVNLDNTAALNKAQFTEIQPGSSLSPYTKTIRSYSAKMNKKVARVGLLAAAFAAKNKKTAMRDAVSSRKTGKVYGKNITQLLEDQQAIKQLSTAIKSLKSSSAKLTATSNWLYIVSK
ncbi:MAG TPA: hypothetical protein DCL44_01915 [Elusimicrobia bacterium]|nr:hypothetical protein [Elusimicrobiota bacterium]